MLLLLGEGFLDGLLIASKVSVGVLPQQGLFRGDKFLGLSQSLDFDLLDFIHHGEGLAVVFALLYLLIEVLQNLFFLFFLGFELLCSFLLFRNRIDVLFKAFFLRLRSGEVSLDGGLLNGGRLHGLCRLLLLLFQLLLQSLLEVILEDKLFADLGNGGDSDAGRGLEVPLAVLVQNLFDAPSLRVTFLLQLFILGPNHLLEDVGL